MALRENTMYMGSDAPWARAISNLGTALFGDPVFKAQQEARAEDLAMRKTAQDSALATAKLQQEQLTLANQASRDLMARNAAWALGRTDPKPDACGTW